MYVILKVLGLLLPLTAHAGIFWTEDFEGTNSQVESRWAASCGANWTSSQAFSLSSTHKVSGQRSLQEYVNGLTNRMPEYLSSTCFIDRDYPAVEKLFVRWYERTDSAFKYDPSNVKTINLGPKYYYPSWWIGHWQGSMQLTPVGQAVFNSALKTTTPNYKHNKSAKDTPFNQWVCVEIQLEMNTPGANNGIVRMWTDGTLNAEYTAEALRGPNVGERGANSSTAKFEMLRIYGQHGVGYRWFDDIAVGDSRIGCGATPPQPSAPAAPKALKAL